uniref:Uncharacterized protein n=1 Tax=Glossina palpalis gambiensis TaxID=67801 RepID=A0A1B0BUD7_9MUSC
MRLVAVSAYSYPVNSPERSKIQRKCKSSIIILNDIDSYRLIYYKHQFTNSLGIFRPFITKFLSNFCCGNSITINLTSISQFASFQNIETRRASRRASLRRGSISILPQKSAEIPWDILERLFMPFLFCHAAAIIISTLLHAFNLSTISTFAVFVWFALSTVGAVLFYHFVKVSYKE